MTLSLRQFTLFITQRLYYRRIECRPAADTLNMIYTITLNPTLDYIVKTDNFQLNTVNRSSSEEIIAGGKGVNVSIALKNLDVDNTAMGFIAGFTGDVIENRLKKLKVKTDFIKLSNGFSRINIKIKSENEIETQINAQGPSIFESDFNSLLDKLAVVKSGDIVVLSGSAPPSTPDNIYETIAKIVTEKGANIVVDASGPLLLKTLKYKPMLIKPNIRELEETLKIQISGKKDIKSAAYKLKELGAKNVLVSMSANGAVLLSENNHYFETPAVKGDVVNSSGAGDAMVAGYLYGWLISRDHNYSLRMGAAAGSATVFCVGTAIKDEIIEIFEIMK